jgi:hypothetical protein
MLANAMNTPMPRRTIFMVRTYLTATQTETRALVWASCRLEYHQVLFDKKTEELRIVLGVLKNKL